MQPLAPIYKAFQKWLFRYEHFKVIALHLHGFWGILVDLRVASLSLQLQICFLFTETSMGRNETLQINFRIQCLKFYKGWSLLEAQGRSWKILLFVLNV